MKSYRQRNVVSGKCRMLEAVRGRTVRWLLPVVGLGLVGGCFVDLYGGASDVPCIDPEWTGTVLWLRPDGEGGFLMTTQTREDLIQDRKDGSEDAHPHQPLVLRFDSLKGEFAVVEAAVWDATMTQIQRCCGSFFEEGPLQVVGDRLQFNGRTVPVVGGTALDMDDAPTLSVAAVLSTNGFRTLFGAATGQHYHQLFSLETGRPIGPVLRLGVGGRNFDRTFIGWTDDESYVLYMANQLEGGGVYFCVVPVEELVAAFRDDAP